MAIVPYVAESSFRQTRILAGYSGLALLGKIELKETRMGDFQSDLPTCTWLEWRSPQAQAAWTPWITQCRNAFRKIEILSVISGYRRAAIVMCSPEWATAVQPPRKAPPLKVVQLQSPASSHGRSSPARNGSYAIASGEYIDTLVAAWGDGGDGTDHETIGELLGFPRCCQDSFRKICVERRCKDPMWRIALNSASGVLERTATVSGHDEANVMLWALGIRAVCHRPCSFYCDATAEIGRGLLAIGAAHGLLEEVGRIRYMLSWPAQWSSFRASVEIETPILKINSTNADSLEARFIVQRRREESASAGWEDLAWIYASEVRPYEISQLDSKRVGIGSQ